jgi:eukaryotic-like serine/threonine-protein kinase
MAIPSAAVRYRRPVADEALIGAVLEGRYRIAERVAAGAMGVVYRAERLKLGRQVAIKFLHDEVAEDESFRKRFEVEARAMARLQHPHCASVIDFGVHDGAPFVVMDFVEGVSLRDLLDDDRLPIARAAEIIRQVLSGLAHAHDLGIVHRDIKPANILVGEKAGLGEQVRILDFGLARMTDGDSRLTVGIAIGTPSYMAPEQTTGGEIDERTDIYACGVLLFEMLTGDKPFVADEPIDVIRMHRESPPPRLADRVPGAPFGDLEDVVARAMAKAPDDRYASARVMAAAVEAAMAGLVDGEATVPDGGATVPDGRAPMPAPAPAPMPAPAPFVPPPAARPRHLSRGLIAAAAGVAGIGAIALIAALAGGRGHPGRDAGVAVVAGSDTGAADPAAAVLARARQLADAGDRDRALSLLASAREVYPGDAELPYLMGQLYFDKLWWSDGIDAYRAAIHLRPAYRTDPELIKSVLRGFITTPDYEPNIARFLREDVGAAAVPYLQETASSHPRAKVRARASAELARYH